MKISNMRNVISACAFACLFALPATARDMDAWGSSGWMDTNSASARPQPRFDRQWWETDSPGTTNRRSGSDAPQSNCRDVASRAEAVRQGLGRDLDDYARCLAAGSKAPDDCARPFDRVKTGQYEYERVVRDWGDHCR